MHLWQPYQSQDLGSKDPKTGMLLAYNAQRRHRAGKKMQDLSGACPNLSPPLRDADLNHKSLAFSTVGARHIGAPTH